MAFVVENEKPPPVGGSIHSVRWLGRLGSAAGGRAGARVDAWRPADLVGEVADEVRLVEVTEFEGEGRATVGLPRRDLLGGLMGPIALEDPLRPDADVPAKEPLQGSLRNGVATSELRDGGSGSRGEHVADHAADEPQPRVGRRQSLAEEHLDCLDMGARIAGAAGERVLQARTGIPETSGSVAALSFGSLTGASKNVADPPGQNFVPTAILLSERLGAADLPADTQWRSTCS